MEGLRGSAVRPAEAGCPRQQGEQETPGGPGRGLLPPAQGVALWEPQLRVGGLGLSQCWVLFQPPSFTLGPTSSSECPLVSLVVLSRGWLTDRPLPREMPAQGPACLEC